MGGGELAEALEQHLLGLAEGSLPVAEAIHRQVLSLPMGPTLTLAQAAVVVDACRDFFVKG